MSVTIPRERLLVDYLRCVVRLPCGTPCGNLILVASSSSARLTRSERRRLIEDAATELFARRGYAATTVEDIVRGAGVTKPMLYRHYESKQELCIALLERHRDELVAAPLAVFDPEAGDRRTQLGTMIGAWLEHARRHPDATRLLFTPITGDREVGRTQQELYDRQRATQVALLREFAPGLDEAEAEPMGEIVRSSLAAVALWWLDHTAVPRELLVQVLVRLVEGLIETPARSEHRSEA
jgi:AcrR family transcriptional regulator